MKQYIAYVVIMMVALWGQVGGISMAEAFPTPIKTVRVTWDAVPNAVMYEMMITKGISSRKQDIVKRVSEIYTLGYELDTSLLQVRGDDLHWSVRAMDIRKQALNEFSVPKPLLTGEINPSKPMTTGEYDKMPFAKAYPVYSWIPVNKASEYEIQIFRSDDGPGGKSNALLRTYRVPEQRSSNYYDDDAYVREGVYWWRVRAKNAMRMPIGKWSERQYFEVTKKNVQVAALGDSITHGGGAVTVPPSYMMYDWETYTGIPILNLGYSGDTVEKMVNRFNRDVVYFSPPFLVIMGGVNNIRLADKADFVIRKLNQLKYKCLLNGITPIFITITPVNPEIMRKVSCIPVAAGWKAEQQKVNEWIMKQRFYVDVTEELTAPNGYLKESLSADGLHPDADAKKIIGEKIGAYLKSEFSLNVK